MSEKIFMPEQLTGDDQLVLSKKEKDDEFSGKVEDNKFGVVESSNKEVVLDKMERGGEMVEEKKDNDNKQVVLDEKMDDNKETMLENNEELNLREFKEETEVLKKEHPEAFEQLEKVAIANGFKKLLLLSKDKTHDWSIIGPALDSKTADVYSESQLIAHEKLMKEYDSDFAQKAADAETKYCVKRREGEAYQSVKIASKKMQDMDKEEFLNLSSDEQLESLKKSVGHFGGIEAQKDIIALNESFKKEDMEKFITDYAMRKVYMDFLNDGEESLNKESQYDLGTFIKPEIIEKIKTKEKEIKDELLETQQKKRGYSNENLKKQEGIKTEVLSDEQEQKEEPIKNIRKEIKEREKNKDNEGEINIRKEYELFKKEVEELNEKIFEPHVISSLDWTEEFIKEFGAEKFADAIEEVKKSDKPKNMHEVVKILEPDKEERQELYKRIMDNDKASFENSKDIKLRSDLKHRIEKIEFLKHLDSLGGLPNKVLLEIQQKILEIEGEISGKFSLLNIFSFKDLGTDFKERLVNCNGDIEKLALDSYDSDLKKGMELRTKQQELVDELHREIEQINIKLKNEYLKESKDLIEKIEKANATKPIIKGGKEVANAEIASIEKILEKNYKNVEKEIDELTKEQKELIDEIEKIRI